MNKILASGLIAVMASAAYAECNCNSFYAGANFGVNFSKTKAKVKAHTYAAGDKFGGSSSNWTVVAGGDNVFPQKAIKIETANALSNAYASECKNKNKKTKVVAELFVGYEHKMDNMKFGIDLIAGFDFGKTKIKTFQVKTEDFTIETSNGTLKEKFHIALMPRIGYQFNSDLEGYITFGAKLSSWQLKLPSMAFDQITATTDDHKYSGESKLEKKNSIRITPVIGAGFRYAITDSVFATLEYNYSFKSKAKISKKMAPEFRKISTTGHSFKLGLGYKF